MHELPKTPQQLWFEPPHAAHLSPVGETMQPRPVLHPVWVSQHGWSAAPHGVQVPPPASVSPVQRRPVWQLPPMQQAWPAPPHISHVLLVLPCPGGLLQPSPARQAGSVSQHRLPSAPQVVQMVDVPPSALGTLKHSSPALQSLELGPWQQARSWDPQPMHMPPVQRAPFAVQNALPPPSALPRQHA